jgi:uncharacterized membrane protein
MKDFYQHPWLIGILLLWLGFTLRLVGLAQNPLWLDELFSVAFAAGMSPETIIHIMVSDVHPPLYYIQLHFWMGVVGNSDFALRFNGVLIGILTIASLYAVVRRLVHQDVAKWVAGFLAISAAAIFYAQQLRMYSLLMLVAIWIWYMLQMFLTHPHKLRYRIAYLGVMLAFLYSQGAAFLIFFSTTCYALLWLGQDIVQRREAFLRWLQYQFLVGVLYIPWLFLAANMGVSHVQTPTIAAVAQTMQEIFLGYYPGHAPGVAGSIIILSFVLLFISLFDRAMRGAFLGFGVIPLLAGFVISYGFRPIWITRSMIFVLPFWLLFMAYSVEYLHKRVLFGKARYLIIGFLIGALLTGTLLQQHYPREQWRMETAVKAVTPQVQAGDYVVFPAEIMFWFWGWYTLPPGSILPRITTSVISENNIEYRYLANQPLNTLLQPGETYWFIWDAVFPWDDAEACVQNFSLDETTQINQMMIRHVRVADTAKAPLCLPD